MGYRVCRQTICRELPDVRASEDGHWCGGGRGWRDHGTVSTVSWDVTFGVARREAEMFLNGASNRGQCVALGGLMVPLHDAKEACQRAIAPSPLVSVAAGAVEMV